MRERIQDCLFYLLVIQQILGMCALYWLCRLFGVEVDE